MRYYQLVILCLILSACTPVFTTSKDADNKLASQTLQSIDITLDDVLKAQKLVVLRNENTLYLVDPEYPKPYVLYAFDASERPVGGSIEDIIISSSKQWVAWYSPLKGVVALNVRDLKTKVVQPADDFLNTYPYLEFLPDSDTLLCIIDKGNTLLETELNNFNQSKMNIPYPYGNVFKVSPDTKKIVFVSGFNQSKLPQFLITDTKGEAIDQFSADIQMSDRHMIFWATDSNGLFLIQDYKLLYYPLSDLGNPQIYYKFEENIKINSAAMAGGEIYLLTSDGYWHIIDTATQKEIARAPLEIASELHKPKFYPWQNKSFLIEETVSDSPEQFNRLWLSDLRGVKKMLMDKYNQAIVQTFPQKID